MTVKNQNTALSNAIVACEVATHFTQGNLYMAGQHDLAMRILPFLRTATGHTKSKIAVLLGIFAAVVAFISGIVFWDVRQEQQWNAFVQRQHCERMSRQTNLYACDVGVVYHER